MSGEPRPYTGNRTARVEMTLSPFDKAEWERHAEVCGVSLPFFIHTGVNLLIEQLTDPRGLKHTGTIDPDPLTSTVQRE